MGGVIADAHPRHDRVVAAVINVLGMHAGPMCARDVHLAVEGILGAPRASGVDMRGTGAITSAAIPVGMRVARTRGRARRSPTGAADGRFGLVEVVKQVHPTNLCPA